MKKIFATDVRGLESFSRVGYVYKKMWQTDKWMLWSMTKERDDNGVPKYELWKYKRYVNPDGAEVWAKPCDEDFGTYGWYITGREDGCQRKISEIMGRFEK